MLTVNGRVKVVRRWWHDPHHGSLAPADAVIAADQASISEGVREMACRLNNDGVCFRRAAANLERTAMVRLSGERLRQLVLAEGENVLAVQAANAIPTSFRAVDCVVDPQAEEPTRRVYTGVDGVMVPLVTESEKQTRRQKVRQKRRQSGRRLRPLPPRVKGADRSFKEFKTIVFYDEHGEHWHEVLARRSRPQTGALVRREAKRLGLKYADEVIANVDGASWIQQQLSERPDQLRLDAIGLDFYHLAENVHRCRRRCFGEEDQAGHDWAGSLLHTLKHEGYQPAWETLSAWRAALRSPKKKQAADRLINYLSDRREMIDYPEFLKRGWQIGSGPTESRCKTSTSRLKGRGRRWNAKNAERIAALTTLQDSHQWQHYWPTLN